MQDIQLRVRLPPPLDYILKQKCAGAVRRLFEDITAEVERIRVNNRSLCAFEMVKYKEVGVVVV